MKYDGQYTFDKVTNVYNGGVIHEENQPAHLLIARHRGVHHALHGRVRKPLLPLLPRAGLRAAADRGRPRQVPFLNFTNCFHCKTCDIMDPYQVITWVPPEGGGGPDYKKL